MLANLIHSQHRCVCYPDLGGVIFKAGDLRLPGFHSKLTPKQRNIIMDNLKDQLVSQWGQEPAFSVSDFTTLNECTELVFRSIVRDDTLVAGIKVTHGETRVAELLHNTDIYVLFIYRDPRDVMLSHKTRFEDSDPFTVARRWSKALNAVQTLSHPRLLCIPYEGLVKNDPSVFEKLNRFLGTEVRFDIDALYEGSAQWSNNSKFGDLSKTIDATPVGRWERNDDPGIPCVYTLCEKQILGLGYRPMTVPLAARYRFRTRARVARLRGIARWAWRRVALSVVK